MKISKNIKVLGQKVCPVTRSWTHTDRMTTEGTLSGFQDFPPSTKDRSNIYLNGFSDCTLSYISVSHNKRR